MQVTNSSVDNKAMPTGLRRLKVNIIKRVPILQLILKHHTHGFKNITMVLWIVTVSLLQAAEGFEPTIECLMTATDQCLESSQFLWFASTWNRHMRAPLISTISYAKLALLNLFCQTTLVGRLLVFCSSKRPLIHTTRPVRTEMAISYRSAQCLNL